MSDRQHQPARPRQRNQLIGFFGGGCDRLLHQDMRAGIKKTADDLGVGYGRGADADEIHFSKQFTPVCHRRNVKMGHGLRARARDQYPRLPEDRCREQPDIWRHGAGQKLRPQSQQLSEPAVTKLCKYSNAPRRLRESWETVGAKLAFGATHKIFRIVSGFP